MSATGRHRRSQRRGRRVVLTVLGVLAALAAVVGVQFPTAYGAYIAKVTNNADAVATNPYFTCAAAQAGTSPQAYFTYPLNDSGSLLGGLINATVADTSGSNRPGNYSTSGVTYRTANPSTGTTVSPVCPRDNTTVVTLNGSSGAVYGPTAPSAGPATFTVEIWFKTSSAEGKLIGFGNSRTGSSSQYDRHLYIDSTGHLVFGVYVNGYVTTSSSTTVTDGQWHHAIGTLSSTSGMALYLDGKQVGTDPTKLAETNNTGYWRIGYDNLGGWPGAPANPYFRGQLAYASVYSTALTATQVAQHFAAGR